MVYFEFLLVLKQKLEIRFLLPERWIEMYAMLALRAELDKLTAGVFLILPCRAVLYSVTQFALVDAFNVTLASLK